MNEPTIFALATPPAKSGVAVVRLSGGRALEVLKQLATISEVKPRHAHYVTLRDPSSSVVIDRGLALYFPAPHSFTGEDVVELQLHGSMAVIREILAVLSCFAGCRLAEAGEFTRRAFLNEKMDLVEAEGLADLIDASTHAQKTQAMRQMQGEMSGFYEAIRTQTIQCLALLEAYIDFPDEEIPDSVLAEWRQAVGRVQQSIRSALADHKRGERLREGLSIVILGAPNAGKSSLLNVLAKREAAIVSHHAGTTRDVIEVQMDIAGFPITLMDTAGLREAADVIEEEGIRRALARAAEADITLLVVDSCESELDKQISTIMGKNSLLIASKIDAHPTPAAWAEGAIALSTRTGQGVEQLLSALEERVIAFFGAGEAVCITRERHRSLLIIAEQWLEKALAEKPLELACEELRQAALAIGSITGKIAVDDILDVIFRQFCIGK